MSGFIDWLQREWGVIWRAPVTFIVGALVIMGVTWAGATAFFKEEVTATAAQVGDIEKQRDYWKDVANQKAPVLQQVTPALGAPSPTPTQPPQTVPYSKPSPKLPIPAKPIQQSNAGDTYTNTGTNNGIVGPVTFGRPSFVLTDAMVSKIISLLPSGKPVVVQAVGDDRAVEMGQTTAQALTAAGFQVQLVRIGMLVPPPNAPVSISKGADQSVVTIAPAAGS
jgi:hypothetical protein